MYAKDPYEAKYQFLANKRESIGLKYFNNPKAFIEYSKWYSRCLYKYWRIQSK